MIRLSPTVRIFLFLAITAAVSSCLKQRTVDLGPGPGQVAGDTIRTGAIYINEVNNRWGVSNLSNELTPQLARRFDAASGEDDWKDGLVKWFELYNNTDRAINFGDTTKGYWYISDNRQARMACPVRAAVTIPSKGYVIVYSSDTTFTAGNQIHACFNVGRNNTATRDTLGLYYQPTKSARLITVDSMTYSDAARTETWSRIPDGGSLITKTTPTPGTQNRQ
jgi:hypothetical protein